MFSVSMDFLNIYIRVCRCGSYVRLVFWRLTLAFCDL